ncbi:MAG TPA: flagellar motor switch protein FliN [Bryobacteraceae bacterium]|nr:flagellar motor switch protein FliN [Bryobacteraceae bacterium]
MSQDNDALWLAEEWTRQFSRTMESMTGESVAITFGSRELSAEEIDPARQDQLWWDQPLSLSPEARIWIGAPAASWQEIGNRVLRSAGVDDAAPDDVRSTYLEIVNQSLSGVASTVSTRARKEISCGEGKAAPPPPSHGGAAYSFEVKLGEQTFALLAVFTLALANLSDSPPQPSAKPAAGDRAQAAATVPAGSIDLLLDVELPVSVSFGRAQLMLKDVIKLTTGSIVELNRSLAEPVEVIVNNCVIARGEVVVVEGNYGIRIKQVISRQERLRTLY